MPLVQSILRQFFWHGDKSLAEVCHTKCGVMEDSTAFSCNSINVTAPLQKYINYLPATSSSSSMQQRCP